MRIFRSQSSVTDVPIDLASVLVDVAVAVRGALLVSEQLLEQLEETGSISDRRAEAVAAAQQAGAFARLAFLHQERFVAEVAEPLQPFGALHVLTRVAYALAAATQPEPEPLALLSLDELCGLPAEYGIEDWLEEWLSVAPEDVEP